MKEALIAKYTQHEDLREKLVQRLTIFSEAFTYLLVARHRRPVSR